MRKLDTAEFIRRAMAVHGDTYVYTQSVYVMSTAKLTVVCPEHGPFQQTPDAHLHGKGCPACRPRKAGATRSLKTPEFVAKAVAVHGQTYDYSRVRCDGTQKEVEIGCALHGFFWQKPHVHVGMRSGCPECGRLKRGLTSRTSTAEFVAKAAEKHGGRYDYSRTVYDKATNMITVRCPAHGDFRQQAGSHLCGAGCPECYRERAGDGQRHTPESFMVRAKQAHMDAGYTYVLDGYRSQDSRITIICPEHGPFRQMAKRHLAGTGCPACARGTSRAEHELYEWVRSVCPDAQRGATVVGSYTFDVYVPSAKIAVEYNGMYWHSNSPLAAQSDRLKRDHAKWRACQKAGITLFIVWECDWKSKREVVQHWLRHKLGKAGRLCGARQTEFRIPTRTEAQDFYRKYHLQGPVGGASHHFGLKFGSAWVAMVTLSKSAERNMRLPDGEYYFTRLALAGSVPGGASKLFKHAVTSLGARCVHAHSDNSYADGEVKALLGFKQDGVLPPRYRLWHPVFGVRHRSFWQKSNIRRLLGVLGKDASLFDPETDSTFYGHHVCGARHVWDCGKQRWTWRAS